MRAEPVGAAATEAPRRAPVARFGPALARARADAELTGPAVPSRAPGSLLRAVAPPGRGTALDRSSRRSGEGDAATSVTAQRQLADASSVMAPPPPPRSGHAAAAPALGPAAIDHLAFAVEARGNAVALQITVAPEVSLHIARGADGVDLALHAGRWGRGVARAELRGMVDALRARGIQVASSSVVSGRGAAR